MNPDKLLDAIGLLDDRHFSEEQTAKPVSWRRRLSVALAAVLALCLCIGTALAVSPQLRKLVFSIFHIKTTETPPAVTASSPTQSGTAPTQSPLQELGIVDIDGAVEAMYFTTEGIVLTYDSGFYTCSRTDPDVPATDAAFWEIRSDGIVNIGAERIDFTLSHGDRSFRILFDYAIIAGRLCIKVWPMGLDKNPIGNGWNVTAIGQRTDVALLSVPVSTGTDYTHDYLLLDLTTLETTDLLSSIDRSDLTLDYLWLTDDLHWGLLTGIGGDDYWWVCDLTRNTLISLNDLTGVTATEPYFLDNETLVFQEALGNRRINLHRLQLTTGTGQCLLSDIPLRQKGSPGYRGIQRNGAQGAHCLIYGDDGTVTLYDLRTQSKLPLTGIDPGRLITSESPDGSRVLLAYEERNDQGHLGYGFSQLGILDPETGVVRMLTRQVNGSPEDLRGWLSRDTVAITATDAAGNYYVYVYTFRND